jgi:hypothetical protein
MTVMVVLMPFSTCYASSLSNGVVDSIKPLYESVLTHKEELTLGEPGKGKVSAEITPLSSNPTDRVSVEIKVTKLGSTSTVYQVTRDMKYSSGDKNFIFSDSFNMSISGVYIMNTTYTCYKNGVQTERIKGTVKRLSI